MTKHCYSSGSSFATTHFCLQQMNIEVNEVGEIVKNISVKETLLN